VQEDRDGGEGHPDPGEDEEAREDTGRVEREHPALLKDRQEREHGEPGEDDGLEEKGVDEPGGLGHKATVRTTSTASQTRGGA
jgi:hypothetical protein